MSQIEVSKSTNAYDACLKGLLETGGGVAGAALLDARGAALYQRRVDQRLPCTKDGLLLSAAEGQALVAAVKGLTDDGLCRQDRLSCTGIWYRVFGGTPLGIYAVGPARRSGLIVRTLPRTGYLMVLYRRPHLAQQVVPHVEKFVDNFLDGHIFR